MKRSFKKLPSLSLFFPAYNEAGNIEESVKQALLVLPKVAVEYEVLVINDGSTDATRHIAERMSAEHGCVRVISQDNQGYGGALKRGFEEARYEWIFFTDSDLQFRLQDLISFVPHSEKYDVILGYRTSRAEGWKRDMLARALKIWNKVFLGFPHTIKDIDCAFKLIRKEVIDSITPLYSNGAMISTELLLKIHRSGVRYHQVGVSHYLRYIGRPTGNRTGVIIKAVRDTFALQWLLVKESGRNATKVIANGSWKPSRLNMFLAPKFVYTKFMNGKHS